jgi:hypothetical protein
MPEFEAPRPLPGLDAIAQALKAAPARAAGNLGKLKSIDHIQRVQPRGEATPGFRITYETAQELNLRLKSSYIKVDGRPVFVKATAESIYDEVVGGDPIKDRGPGLCCIFMDGSQVWLRYDSHDFDTRSFEPGYIEIRNSLFSLIRRPLRVFQQGMTAENTRLVDPVTAREAPLGGFQTTAILSAVTERDSVIEYSPAIQAQVRRTALAGVVQGRRLSNRVALVPSGTVEDDGSVSLQGISIVFQDVKIGSIPDDSVPRIENSRFCRKPWVDAELRRVNLL